MDQESIEPRQEPTPTEETSAESAVAMETQAEECVSSNASDSEPEFEQSPAAGNIVAEVRDLYANASKVDILIRLIQSRTVEVRCQRQLQVYRMAFEEGIKEKTRLQLDLAYYDKMLAVLQRGAHEAKSMLVTVTQQHADAVKMVEKLDRKRTEFIREEQQIKAELAGYKAKFEEIQEHMQNHSVRFEAECRRRDQLLVQVDKLTEANEVLQKKVAEHDAKQDALVSAHSARLNEMENMRAILERQLKDTQDRVEAEKRTNALLKEHTDVVLQEKTQLAMDLATVENRIAAMEAEFARETAALEAKWDATVQEVSERTNEKLAEMARSTQELSAEKDLLVAKLAQQKDVTVEMEAKLGGMQAILEDRNNEIFSLHSKLNCELKRFEELKQQHSQEITEVNNHLSDLLKQSDTKDSKIAHLEQELRAHVDTLSAVKSQLESKDDEIKQLKEKFPNVDHYMSKIAQLQAELDVKSSRLTQLEKRRASTETRLADANMTAQITSTPISVVEEQAGNDEVLPKRNCPSPSYTSFQGSVQRRSFFKRTTTAAMSATSVSLMNMNLNLSSASTLNVDDEPLDVGNMSSASMASSSIRHVKPFFRKIQEKK